MSVSFPTIHKHLEKRGFFWKFCSVTTFQVVSEDPTYTGNIVHSRSSELQQNHSGSEGDVPTIQQTIFLVC